MFVTYHLYPIYSHNYVDIYMKAPPCQDSKMVLEAKKRFYCYTASPFPPSAYLGNYLKIFSAHAKNEGCNYGLCILSLRGPDSLINYLAFNILLKLSSRLAGQLCSLFSVEAVYCRV